METPAAPVIDTSSLPIIAGNEPKDDPNGMMERFKEIEEAVKAEPAKGEEKKAETAPEVKKTTEEAEPKADDVAPDDAPEKATPKAKETWATLKAKAAERDRIASEKAEIEKERESLKAELAELKKDDPALYKKQIESKDKELTAYEQKVALLDVRASKEYNTAVLAPMAEIGASVKEIAATYDANPSAIEQALLNPDPAAQRKDLNALLADFSDIDKNEIIAAARQVRAITAKAMELESKAHEAKKELDFRRHQEAEQQKTASQKKMTEAGEVVWKALEDKLPMLKDETIAAKVRKAELDPQDPAMKAYNAYAGMVLAETVKDLNAKTAKIKELEGQLAARRNASPRAGSETTTAAPEAVTTAPQGDDMIARFNHMKAQQRVA